LPQGEQRPSSGEHSGDGQKPPSVLQKVSRKERDGAGRDSQSAQSFQEATDEASCVLQKNGVGTSVASTNGRCEVGEAGEGECGIGRRSRVRGFT
jgi:hypothetical protein